MELSLDDKVGLATQLALIISYDGKKERELPEHFDFCLIDRWEDGLPQKRLFNLKSGLCSLQATIDFDFDAEEAELDKTIMLFLQYIHELGIVLDKRLSLEDKAMLKQIKGVT